MQQHQAAQSGSFPPAAAMMSQWQTMPADQVPQGTAFVLVPIAQAGGTDVADGQDRGQS